LALGLAWLGSALAWLGMAWIFVGFWHMQNEFRDNVEREREREAGNLGRSRDLYAILVVY